MIYDQHHTLRVVIGLCFCIATAVCAFPRRIPIGAVFDRSSARSMNAFLYAVNRHNNDNGTTLVKLNSYAKLVDSADSYALQKAVCSILAKGTFSVFADVRDASLSTMNAYSRTLHVPIIVPGQSANASLAPNPFSLNMRPQYQRAIIDVLMHYNWRTAVYIYDTEQGLYRLQQLFSALQTQGSSGHIDIDVVRLLNVNDSYAQLRRIDRHGATDDDVYIILDLNEQTVLQTVLMQIQNLGMNRANYHYLLGGLIMDELNLEDFRYGGVNITGFRLIDPQRKVGKAGQKEIAKIKRPGSRKDTDKFIKISSALAIDALSVTVKGLKILMQDNPTAIDTRMFRRGKVYNHDKEGILCDTSNPVPWVLGEKILNAYRKVAFKGLTGWVQFDERGQRTNYTLEVLELNLDTHPRRIGEWKSSSGLEIEKRKPHEENKQQSRNRTKLVTSIAVKPYLMLKDMPADGKLLVGNDRFKGYSVDLAKKLAEVVGFDYIIRLVKDGKFGNKVGDSWNGMVGELYRNEADMAIAPLTITVDREKAIDFSKPFMSLGISIMIKKPEKQKPGVFSFMYPLSYKIWLYVILAYIGVSLVLFLVSRFSPYEWQIEDSAAGPTFTNDFTIMNSLWFALGAIMQQGCDISPRSLSGRMVGAVWWFCTLILISSYTANLAAFLTVERMLTPIESADDLAAQTAIQYGALSSGSTQHFFKTSKIDVYNKMWNFMNSTPSAFVNETRKGVQRVRDSKGKYAFLLESTMNDFYNQRKPCNTMKVGANLDAKGYGIATPLGSDLREKISLAVLQMKESGFLAKLRKKWWYDKGECPHENDGGSKKSALTLSNVAGVFYILIGGLGLSMLTSLLEFLYKSRRESRRQKKRFGSSKPIAPKAILPARRDSLDGYNGRKMATSASQSTVPIARSSAISLV